ncbi:MAG: hypothetical protein ABIE70_01880 [bacterium]
MPLPYEILPYSIQTLKQILSDKSRALPAIVDSKLHLLYFEHYFNDLGAATILVENEYIDRDFMEDYAGFYARCFGKYESSCTRLHFFDRSFTERQFAFTLLGRGRKLSPRDLQDSYLGFIVVKKLPVTFVGRTCLKTYDPHGGRRFYPTLRQYKVGLYGVNLIVKRTLAFQEQDRGASACATSALWSVFQATGKLFQHAIPSPVEITQLATQIPDEEVPGILPSRGLTGRQEIYAIRQLGLEAEHTSAQNVSDTTGLAYYSLTGPVYAYLRAGIPLLLRVTLYDTSYSPFARCWDGHAVAVTGFSLGRSRAVPYQDWGFKTRDTRIDKIYVHDDQVGPFARMRLDGVSIPVQVRDGTSNMMSLSTSWRGDNGVVGSVRAVPRFHVVPLYPKIRIRFEFVWGIVLSFDKFFRERLFGTAFDRLKSLVSPLEWDIQLTLVNDRKSEIQADSRLAAEAKRRILLSNMPRFIWSAKARYENQVVLELLFDATDIEQGKCFVGAVKYSSPLFDFLKQECKIVHTNAYYHSKPHWRIIEWFASEK